MRNTAELARLMHVTQPRITQVMQLLHLAPDIQEELLFLPPIERGCDRVAEKHLRAIAAQTRLARTAGDVGCTEIPPSGAIVPTPQRCRGILKKNPQRPLVPVLPSG